MEFNPSKCQVVHVTSSRAPFDTRYILHGQVLEAVTSARYLGVDISNNLSWNTHVNRVASNASWSLGFIKRNVKTKSPKSGKWHMKPLFIPSWSTLQLYGTPHTQQYTIRLKWFRDMQPGGPWMIMPEQPATLHCCTSWAGKHLKRDNLWPVSVSFTKLWMASWPCPFPSISSPLVGYPGTAIQWHFVKFTLARFLCILLLSAGYCALECRPRKRCNYAPNFEEVDRAYWFRVVRACIHPFVKNRACKGFEILYMDSSWKNRWHTFFFLVWVISLSGVMPLWKNQDEHVACHILWTVHASILKFHFTTRRADPAKNAREGVGQ